MVILAAHPIKSGLNLPGPIQTSSPFRWQTPCSGYPHSPHHYIVTEKIPITINPRLIHGILKQVKSFRQKTSLCELQADRQWKTCSQLFASFLFAAATWCWSISTRPSVPGSVGEQVDDCIFGFMWGNAIDGIGQEQDQTGYRIKKRRSTVILVTASSITLHLLYQFQIKALPSLARLRLLNVVRVRLRRLNPRRLGFIFDLKLKLPASSTTKSSNLFWSGAVQHTVESPNSNHWILKYCLLIKYISSTTAIMNTYNAK